MKNEQKHAFLIMAHHRPDLLARLLAALDDPRNDIYLHIDSKAASEMNADWKMSYSKLVVVDPINVNWGGYSQIECELKLLEAAVTGGEYSRHHLLTGSTYPVKSQDEIHSFFDANSDKEFIAIDDTTRRFYDRVQYRKLFNESFRNSGFFKRILRRAYLMLQIILHVDRFKRFNMDFAKGLAYWSISNEFAEYIVSNKSLIEEMCRYSECGDEIFMQTMAVNSPYNDRLFDDKDVLNGSLRASTWEFEDAGEERYAHSFIKSDLQYILDSGAFFAFKFEGPDGHWLIDQIQEKIS